MFLAVKERDAYELAIFAKERGYNVKLLSEMTGIGRITIWRHGTGVLVPSIEDREQYALVLKVSVGKIDEIIDRARSMTSSELIAIAAKKRQNPGDSGRKRK